MAIDFVRINQQAVRLTSVTRDEDTQRATLVVIVRGDAARNELTDLLNQQPLQVEFPDEEALTMRIAELDLRSTGEGVQALHRFAIDLEPFRQDLVPEVSESTAESALMQRLDAIEDKLDQALALLDELLARRR